MAQSDESSPPEKDAAARGIQETLIKTVVSLDLLKAIENGKDQKDFGVIVEFDRSFPGGTARARLRLLSAYARAKKAKVPDAIPAQYAPQLDALDRIADAHLVKMFGDDDTLCIAKSMWTDNYVFGRLTEETILALASVRLPGRKGSRLVYKIWFDQPLERFVYASRQTVKCDAAGASFAAAGKDIVWAVADTGIDGRHQHFQKLETLKPPDGLRHHDFTGVYPDDDKASEAALVDEAGHGTHVAGIIAGVTCINAVKKPKDGSPFVKAIKVQIKERPGQGDAAAPPEITKPISGTAPECKLISLKVMKGETGGDLSSLIAAIGYIQKANEYGRHLKIHGLNLSVGYLYDPVSFAAGQSPLCVEVDRLVRSGVCVVVAAGNGGYGTVTTHSGRAERAAHLCTISDPGNAALAITVGSTHREMPHTYGVSYFSAKGPTADARAKPDLVAPGERIVSCALSTDEDLAAGIANFKADSGTSMAAPHVSGAIAAFLSVRREFLGQPETVKGIFVNAATDLRRREEFQGAGLLDLMRALQAV